MTTSARLPIRLSTSARPSAFGAWVSFLGWKAVKIELLVCFAALMTACLLAQGPPDGGPPPGSPPPQDSQPNNGSYTLKVNSDIVLTNVVVRDKKTGEVVRGLTPKTSPSSKTASRSRSPASISKASTRPRRSTKPPSADRPEHSIFNAHKNSVADPKSSATTASS